MVRRELQLQFFLVFDRTKCVVDTEHLMVARDYLPRAARPTVVKQNRVLYQIEQSVFIEHAIKQNLSLYAALFHLVVALPLTEVFPLAGNRAVTGTVAVA